MSAPERSGVLPIDKPVGPTSHDVVGAVRRAFGTRRVGHTGTLDPFASGLLLMCVGNATRLAEFLTGMDKRYVATVRLGRTTDTDDHTGAVVAERDASGVTADAVEAALAAMRGNVLQTPPAYSAKKRGGERAYVAAREGRPMELEPVPVTIHELRATSFDPPYVDLDIRCASGTYIRAIARDLGEALGVGGHLTALRRTAVGAFDVSQSVGLDRLDDEAAVDAVWLTPLQAVAGMPRVDLEDADVALIRHGRAVRAEVGEGTVALAAGDALIAIAESAGDGLVRPRKVFV